MNMKYLISSLLVVATVIPTTALAQTSTQPAPSETLPETYYRAFFRNAPDFYRDRSLSRQLNFIFGIGSFIRNSFPENEYIRDANLINTLYQDTLQQQIGSSPTLRTPDLPNPYSSSLFATPPLEAEFNAPAPQEESTPSENEVDPAPVEPDTQLDTGEDPAPVEPDTQLDNGVDTAPLEPDTQPQLETVPIE